MRLALVAVGRSLNVVVGQIDVSISHRYSLKVINSCFNQTPSTNCKWIEANENL
jgi:hypothetical protein